MIFRYRKQLILAGLMLSASFIETGLAQQQWQLRGPSQNVGVERQALLAEVPAVEAYNVLLITIDSLRPDALGCYGSTLENPSPHIDRFAKQSHLFESAFASSPDADLGLLGLMSSLLPTSLAAGMSDLCPSLAALFADHNFSTRGIISFASMASSKSRLSRADNTLGFGRRLSITSYGATMAAVAARLISSTRGQSTLVHVHLDSTRAPATTHPGFDFGDTPAEHYAAAVRWVDQLVGQITQSLRKSGVDQHTIVILTSPSPITGGDSDAGSSLTDSNLRVPLLIYIPGLPQRKVTAPVSTIDIAPTLASLYGFKAPYSFQGRSFLEALLGVPRNTRKVYSEALSSRIEGVDHLGATVRSSEWRLVLDHTETQQLLTATGSPASALQLADAPVDELVEALENSAIYITACNQLWGRGDEAQPDMIGAQGDLSRAEWLISNGDNRAHSALIELLSSAETPTPLLMEFLLKIGQPTDAAIAKRALTSDNIEVRALAGAFLVRQGQTDQLSIVTEGLQHDTKPHRQIILLQQIGATGDPTALKPVLDFSPTSPEVIAARTLALVQMGHEESEGKLIRHILSPTATYAKAPFIQAFIESFPKRAIGVLSLALTDGDSRPDTVLAVLKQIRALQATTLDEQVARAITHEDKRVREQAASILQEWSSLSGSSGLLQLAASSPSDAGWAAAQIMKMPLLIGSTAVPGLRLDVLAIGKDPKLLNEGVLTLDWAGQQFAFQLDSEQQVSHLAIALHKSTKPFAADEIVVNINGKRITSANTKLEAHDGQLIMILPITAQSVGQGANQVHLRAKPSASGVLPIAFFILSGNQRHEVQGGAEKTGGAVSVPIQLNRDPRVFRLWGEGVGVLPVGTEPTRIHVRCKEGPLGTITLPRDGGTLSRTLQLPAKVWRLNDLRIQIEGGSEVQRAVAVITGLR